MLVFSVTRGSGSSGERGQQWKSHKYRDALAQLTLLLVLLPTDQTILSLPITDHILTLFALFAVFRCYGRAGKLRLRTYLQQP